MMAGKFKSEISEAFYRSNQKHIEDAVDAVKARYRRMQDSVADGLDKSGYESMVDRLQELDDMKTVIDAYDWLHAGLHHFQKYHAVDSDAFGHGQHYLGTQCGSCEYSRSQQRAIDENAK
jgi:hypothetical protein